IEETVAEHPELLLPGVLDPVVDRFTYKLPAVARVSVVMPQFTILADSRLPVGQPSDETSLLPLLRRVGEERFYYRTRGGRYLRDRKSTRLNSSHVKISYAVFCLKKKTTNKKSHHGVL